MSAKVSRPGPANQLRLPNGPVAQGDVDRYVIETSAGELAACVVTHGSALLQLVQPSHALDGKDEIVAKVRDLSGQEVRRCRLFVVLTAQVHVLGCSCSVTEPVVEGTKRP